MPRCHYQKSAALNFELQLLEPKANKDRSRKIQTQGENWRRDLYLKWKSDKERLNKVIKVKLDSQVINFRRMPNVS